MMNDNGLKFLHIGDGAKRRGIAVRAQSGAPLCARTAMPRRLAPSPMCRNFRPLSFIIAHRGGVRSRFAATDHRSWTSAFVMLGKCIVVDLSGKTPDLG